MAEIQSAGSGAITTKRDLAERVLAATGRRPAAITSLGISRHPIFRIELADGATVIAKLARRDLSTEPEAYMLDYLSAHSSLPVPKILHADSQLIVMEFVHGERGHSMTNRAQESAAEALVALHAVSGAGYGHERATVLGPIKQPNPWSENWSIFFRDQRLMYMARTAIEAGHLGVSQMRRIEALATRIDEWLDEPSSASLLHGDLRGGNILVSATRVAAFLDPAIYHGDAEMDLVHVFLYRGLNAWFLRHYWTLSPPRPGFAERLKIYSLYHLLRDVARNPEPIHVARLKEVLDSIGI